MSAATAGGSAQASNVLELSGVSAGFGSLTVLRDIDLTVAKGTPVALLGANGAGKTTLLRTVAGLLQPTRGTICVDGTDVAGESPDRRARRGLCLIPEGRGIFPSLSVKENLVLQRPSWVDGGHERALEAFPILKDRLGQTAGTMSGGQQQMLALARCYLAEPSVILLDEVSMGLAPRIVDQIFESLAQIAREGVALLLVEQYVTRALEMVDYAYLLDRGRISYSGPASGLDEASVLQQYLGTGLEPAHPDPTNHSGQ